MDIGKQIKALRLRRGVTQEAVAAALGCSAQAVSKWEREECAPDISLLPALSAYFGVTIDELFALSDHVRMERIENMIWDVRHLDPAEAEWLRALDLGDFLARAGEFEGARECYREALRLQTPPRYTDGAASLAMICELLGDYPGAIAAREEGIAILASDWDTREGETVDRHLREIERLKKML